MGICSNSPLSCTSTSKLVIDKSQRKPDLTLSPKAPPDPSFPREDNLFGFRISASKLHQLQAGKAPTIYPPEISYDWLPVIPSENKRRKRNFQSHPSVHQQGFKKPLPPALSMQEQFQQALRHATPIPPPPQVRPSVGPAHLSTRPVQEPFALPICWDELFDFNGP